MQRVLKVGIPAIIVACFIVGCAHTQTRQVEEYGGLVVNCGEGDAQVYVEEMLIGEADDFMSNSCAYPLESGRSYIVKIVKEGYKPYSEEVYVTGGSIKVDAKLNKL